MGTDFRNVPFDAKQLFFNNMKLLGFDAPAMEAAHRIPFNKTMFDLPNRHGAEIVLHFLFERLNPTMCKEYFRDCWPVHDKKREQGFRKTCYNWLSNIAQEEQESHLPRINASLFMSPGGEKFYQLLFYFSGFVRRKVMENELGSRGSERLKYPGLTSQNLQLGDVISKDLICSSIRHRQSYFDTAQLTLKANKTWKESVDGYVKEFRKLNKDIRELDYKIQAENQKSLEASISRGSPVKRAGQPDHLDPNFDPGTIKRAQRVQQVREMWKQLDEFDRTESAEREVVESIVERTINKHKLDAADISIKVPDMLLRECGEEIRRRNVDNTYHGGKLNLVSVLQLWNLCLHLYLEKINLVGVAKFDEDLKLLKSQLHVQQSYQQNAVNLRQQMAESIPELKTSIQQLREKLDGILFQDQSPESIRQTSVGMGLVGPSPNPNFSPGLAVTPQCGVSVARSPQEVDTPIAAERFTEDIRAAVRKGHEELFSDMRLNLDEQDNRNDKSSLPRPSKSGSQMSSRQSSRPTSARSQTSQKSSRPTSARSQASQKSSRPTSARSTASKGGRGTQVTPRNTETDPDYAAVTSPRTLMQSMDERETSNSSRTGIQLDLSNVSTSSRPLSARSDDSKTLSARSEKSQQSVLSARSRGSGDGMDKSEIDKGDNSIPSQSSRPGRKTPTDMLVEEIMGEGKILSPFASGLEAFESHDVVRRTPDMEDINNYSTAAGSSGEAEIEEIQGPELQEDMLGPELEEEYDNGNLSEGSQRSTEQVIVVDRSMHFSPKGLGQSPNIALGPSSPAPFSYSPKAASGLSPRNPRSGSGSMQSPRSPQVGSVQSPRSPKFASEPSPRTITDQSPRFITGFSPEYRVNTDLLKSPKDRLEFGQGDGLQEEQEGLQQSLLNFSPPAGFNLSNNASFDQSPAHSPQRIEETENLLDISPPGSPQDAIIIDRSFSRTPATSDGGARSRTPVQLPSETRLPWSPASRLSQSLMGPVSIEKSPVTEAMLAQLMSPVALSRDIRKMYKEAVGDTPTSIQHVRQMTSKPKEKGEDLEMPNMDPNSRCMSDLEADVGLKLQDISWDLADNIENIEMPDVGLDADMDNDNDENSVGYKTGEVDEDKDTETEKYKDNSVLNIDNDDIDDFFQEKTPELPKRTLVRSSLTDYANTASPGRLGEKGDDSEEDVDNLMDEEPQLIEFNN